MSSGLVFSAADHSYTFDGAPVPGVTTVLDPVIDLDGIPRSVLEKAAARGTAVHRAIELHLLGDLDEASLHPEVAARFYQFLRFCRETGFHVERNEQRVFSARYQYAGTLDLVGKFVNKRVVVDTKATYEIPRSVGPQTAAYEFAFRESEGLPRELPRYCLQLKEDTYRLEKLENKRDFRVFLACLTLQNWRNENAN